MKRLLTIIVVNIIIIACLVNTTNGQQQTTATPVWLKIGAYAEYSFNSPGIAFYNDTFLEFKNNSNLIWRWQCVDLNMNDARILVSLNGTLPNGTICLLKNEVTVNLLNRSVYLDNGTLIGTTHLWLPSNPSSDDLITLWDVAPDKIQMKTTQQNVRGETCQGLQESYTIGGTATGLRNIGYKGNLTCYIMCDSDTGILIDTSNIMGDSEGVLKALNVMFVFVNGRFMFSNTNIDLGSSVLSGDVSSSDVNPMNVLLLIIPFSILFVILVLAILVKNKKNHKRWHKG
jgi:hypothetical protein